MKKFSFFMMLAMAVVVISCKDNTPTPELEPDPTGSTMPYYEQFPIQASETIAEGSEVGVTIEVLDATSDNFVFELRPGATVQSFKLDVYPIANLYNRLLNSYNTGDLEEGDPVAINEMIRSYLFNEAGSGGFAFSINDFDNPEDFLQIRYDWMNTPYAASTAVAIPDCGYLIAVVASVDPSISSSNQEELTLCYVHTTSQPLVGDPQVEIDVTTTYTAFQVDHILNDDAAGVYYFGSLASEIDDYIDTFGDTMFRDFVRTMYSNPVYSSDTEGLKYSRIYGPDAHNQNLSATVAVAVDANLTPQENYARFDFKLRPVPENTIKDIPVIKVHQDRVAAEYMEFAAEMTKHCNTIFYRVYSEADAKILMNADDATKLAEARSLEMEGYGAHNPNFKWNAEDYENEAVGSAGTAEINYYGDLVPGSTVYIGYIGRNGYNQLTDLAFSDPIVLDTRNMDSPEACKIKDLTLTLSEPSRTSFTMTYTYDPSLASMFRIYIKDMDNSELDLDSDWSDAVEFMFTDQNVLEHPINVWSFNPSGRDGYTWTGLEPNTEYAVFLLAEDFEGNISELKSASIYTSDVQVGSDPTVNISLSGDSSAWDITFEIDHDVASFKYAVTENASDLPNLGLGENQLKDLKNLYTSGQLSYDDIYNAIYEWVMELGLDTQYERVTLTFEGDQPRLAGAIGIGEDADGNPVYKLNHRLIIDGKAYTLAEYLGIE